MLVRGLALAAGSRPPRVKRVEVLGFAAAVPQPNDPTPAHPALVVATVLGSPQFANAGVAFVMHAVIDNQKGVRAIVTPVLPQLPYLAGHKPLLAQEIVDHVMAHVFQLLGPRGAGAVLGGAHQILHILLLGTHDRQMLFSAFKRKS